MNFRMSAKSLLFARRCKALRSKRFCNSIPFFELFLAEAHCGCEEDIPRGVVDFFDAIDPGYPSVPPCFQCEKCDGVMLPV